MYSAHVSAAYAPAPNVIWVVDDYKKKVIFIDDVINIPMQLYVRTIDRTIVNVIKIY